LKHKHGLDTAPSYIQAQAINTASSRMHPVGPELSTVCSTPDDDSCK
jgi:hypothetical protein